jgi:hypothetical protein
LRQSQAQIEPRRQSDLVTTFIFPCVTYRFNIPKVRANSTTLASDHGIQQKTDGNRLGAKQKPRCPVAQQRGSKYMVARWS